MVKTPNMVALVEEIKPGDAQTFPTRQEALKSEQESTMKNIRHTTIEKIKKRCKPVAFRPRCSCYPRCFTGCAAPESAKAETEISYLPSLMEAGVASLESVIAVQIGQERQALEMTKNVRINGIAALVTQARTAFDSEMGSIPSEEAPHRAVETARGVVNQAIALGSTALASDLRVFKQETHHAEQARQALMHCEPTAQARIY